MHGITLAVVHVSLDTLTTMFIHYNYIGNTCLTVFYFPKISQMYTTPPSTNTFILVYANTLLHL